MLTVEEAAAHLRLSRSKIYELIAARLLAAYRPGGRLRIPAQEIEKYLESVKVR